MSAHPNATFEKCPRPPLGLSKEFRSPNAHDARSPPRGTRACPPPRKRHTAPQHAPHTPERRPSRALSSTFSTKPTTAMPSPAASQHMAYTLTNICTAWPPLASHEPSPAREPSSRPVSPLPGPWISPTPSLATPCLACQPVRLLLGRQLQYPYCERGRSAQGTVTHARPASLDEPAATTSRVQRLGCRLPRAEKPRLPERTSQGQGSERSNAVLML